MSFDLITRFGSWVKIAAALAPCILSMYLLYYLGKYEIWVPETPHRDKMTIIILIIGMAMSFFARSYFVKRTKK
jgi:hypothetical protein